MTELEPQLCVTGNFSPFAAAEPVAGPLCANGGDAWAFPVQDIDGDGYGFMETLITLEDGTLLLTNLYNSDREIITRFDHRMIDGGRIVHMWLSDEDRKRLGIYWTTDYRFGHFAPIKSRTEQ